MTGPDHRWRREAEEARQRAGDAEERASRLLAELNACGFERDEARVAMRRLLEGLDGDDNPRRAAIESAHVLVASWDRAKLESMLNEMIDASHAKWAEVAEAQR